MTDAGLGTGTSRSMDWSHVVRRLRLGSGLVLFAYVASHLINHAFGLISLDALETVRLGFVWFWRLPPVTLSLY